MVGWRKLLLILAAVFWSHSSFAQITFTEESDGVLFNMPDNGKMKVQVCSDKIIRVVYTLQATIPAPGSYIVVKTAWDPVQFTVQDGASAVSLTTSSLKIDVSKTSGAISYYSGSTLILQETAAKSLARKSVGTNTAYEGTITLNSVDNEGIYGFGQFQNVQINQKGQTLDLVQLNQSDASPMFLSTRGFGVLWNVYSQVKVTPPLTLWCNWATNDAIDYYFMYGPEFDTIIASYRTITGPAPMWPKWAYGYWQCKNYYPTQNDLLTAARTFRAKGYPLDNIVQDWQYYPPGFNGCQCFDAARYPDPAGMIRTLHDSLNCRFTISVWPSFAATCGANYTFMNSRGYLLNSQDYLGTTYDAFNDSAAFYYWKFINDSLVSKDIDAFWPDATEPEWHTVWVTATTAAGPAIKVENMFPVLHSKTLYEGYRRAHQDNKRVCNLTRSYCAGSQRYGAAYWTGDVETDFITYTKQIPAGLNVCMSGLPLYCTDIGGFTGAVEPNVLARWFQFGAFNPVFRIHGTRNTELWLDPQMAVEANMVKYGKLRYRLFPYVYSLAWKVTDQGYTMMRALPFDFRSDVNVRDINNEFMFGPALLVCPVTNSVTATSRNVYLPAGSSWYDFWTGTRQDGGAVVTANAPIDKLPLFVRAGSILPMGPQITYADTAADPIELRVYTGANGSFTLYEDEGDGYAYEQGVYATIPFLWDEASSNLTMGPTAGEFTGMLTSRTFNVVWVSENHGAGGEVTTAIDKAITYNGGRLVLNKITGEIGVTHSVASSRIALPFIARLDGRSYVICVKGNQPVQVRLTDIRGRLLADRTVAGPGSLVIARQLPAGIYCASFKEQNGVSFTRKLVIP
ncbi:MAG: glycoside hydrolase family 31 protein [Chitinispirillaceae bacterium]|nr:glycoside hydrolase family 31 protein [Chitinispirillaceae bacterium]